MLEPRPCPAGKCDAQLYSSGEFVFCPKCRAKNPNYRSRAEVPKATRTEMSSIKQQQLFDLETGVMKW